MERQKQEHIAQMDLLLLSWKETSHGATPGLREGTPAHCTGVSRGHHDVASASVGKTAHWNQLWLLEQSAWCLGDT